MCTKEWKSCECARWDEELLLERAERSNARAHEVQAQHEERLAERRQGTRRSVPAYVPLPTAPVAIAVERMRTAAGKCNHRRSERVEVGEICDACGDGPDDSKLHKYLMRGCDCGIEICRWCCFELWGPRGRRGFPGDLRLARHNFMNRRDIKNLNEAERVQKWRTSKRKRYDTRLRHLEEIRAARIARAAAQPQV